MSNKSPDLSGHKSSRILAQQSSTSLHSKYKKDRDPEEVQTLTNGTLPQRPPTQQSTDSWSLWPKKKGTASIGGEGTDGKSTPTDNWSQSMDSTRTNTGSIDQTTRDGSQSPNKKVSVSSTNSRWLPWNITSTNNNYTSQQDSTSDEEISNDGTIRKPKDQVKAMAEDITESHELFQTKKATRSTSWSFWNNSTNTELVSDSNKFLISSSDVVLFEAKALNPSLESYDNITTSKSNNKKKKPNPKLPNKVVPMIDRSLPCNSTTNSIYQNFTILKHNLGFTVTPPKHLYRHSSTPKDIKKVLIIGVHGFFPTKVIRPLIGEPTGTSLKFTAEAEKCIWRWARRENLNIQVQKIALEKEGKILDRVEFFYKVLERWKEELRDVDFIYVAAHSQGCPVSIILLARLIENGIIDISKVKVSLLAMAGINNGPFYGIDQKLVIRAYSTIESDSLMELFQFQNFDSPNSKEFLKSITLLVTNDIKISFVGSINDQLVPLYSSHALHVRHPNIFRATYVDGDSNTPEFVTRAISIANHLHNVGKSDHGLIKEISNALAGPLTGGGHSRIYNDPQVYDLALNFSLYTTKLPYETPLYFKPYSIDQLGVNPYHLPWCMRGLLYEAKQHFKDGGNEIELLFKEFDEWKPESKVLKDMKYRLNGLKSKL